MGVVWRTAKRSSGHGEDHLSFDPKLRPDLVEIGRSGYFVVNVSVGLMLATDSHASH